MKYDLTGQTFGKLQVLHRAFDPKKKAAEWLCRCECGVEKVVASGSLRNGKVKSCGCSRTAGRLKDISGERYGRLVVLSFHSMAPNRVSKWNAECDCGALVVVRKSHLWVSKEGVKNTVSCGCHRRDVQRERLTKPGDTGVGWKSKEYHCWTNMLQRCTNPKNARYKSYGASGVAVCEQWYDFAQFLKDVGRAPEDKPYIDRIDPYGNYEPSNVRWVDKHTSDTNKRK